MIPFSPVRLFLTLWTIACQSPLSMEFSRQEYWSRLLCSPPEYLPNRGDRTCVSCVLCWQVDSLPLGPSGKSRFIQICRRCNVKRSPQFSSVQFNHSVVSDSLQPHESQHARPPCPSPTPGVYSDSRPSSQGCHQAISSSVVPFSSCPQSLPASESFPMSQLFT